MPERSDSANHGGVAKDAALMRGNTQHDKSRNRMEKMAAYLDDEGAACESPIDATADVEEGANGSTSNEAHAVDEPAAVSLLCLTPKSCAHACGRLP